MREFLYKYTYWLYINHIKEDWDQYSKAGRIFITPFWFIRSVLIWLSFPLWIPSYLFSQSEVFKAYEKFGSLSPEEMRQLNKLQTNQFLSRKKRKK